MEKAEDHMLCLPFQIPFCYKKRKGVNLDMLTESEGMDLFINVLALSDVVITADTGTTHLAYFMNKLIIPIADKEKTRWTPPHARYV